MQTDKLSHPLAHVAHISFYQQNWTWGIKREESENRKQQINLKAVSAIEGKRQK